MIQRSIFKIRLSVPAAMLAFVAATAIGRPGLAADNQPGQGKTVTLGYTVGLLEERFQNQVVAIGLEKMGYNVKEMVQMDVPALHLAVAQGDVDLIAAHWDPLQDAFFQRAGGPAKVTMVGMLVSDCLQGYLVDKRSYDQDKIHNIEQLRDPSIAKLFASSGSGKADLAGCPPGWGCERLVEHQMDAYKLRDTVIDNQGQFDVMAADTIARFKAGGRVVYYTYTPHWISQVLVPGRDVEWLEVPFIALPDKDQMNLSTKLPDGRNIGFPVNTMRIMANNQFLATNPAAKRFFQVAAIPVSDVNAENFELHQGQTSYPDVRKQAEEWIAKNQAKFDGWVAEAKSTAP
jgi:glycine betaine/proline transport system substrate-binding protein